MQAVSAKFVQWDSRVAQLEAKVAKVKLGDGAGGDGAGGEDA